MAYKFTCHAVVDSNSANQPIAWCIVGNGRFYKATFRSAAVDKVKLEYPNAEFENSFSIVWGQEDALRSASFQRWWDETKKLW